MATYSSVTLSGSTSGRLINITSTAAGGNTIHKAASATNVHDEVHLWATNVSTKNRLLTLEVGGTSTGDEMLSTIPYQDGAYTVLPGFRLEGSVSVKARASATDVALSVGGYVNRITP